MKPDEVVGAAVLDDSGPIHWLYHFRRFRDDHPTIPGRWVSDILPVLPAEFPRGVAKLPSHFPENNPWRYVIVGQVLNVRPSINIGSGQWHNAGQWVVNFIRAPNPGDEHACMNLLESLNPPERRK